MWSIWWGSEFSRWRFAGADKKWGNVGRCSDMKLIASSIQLPSASSCLRRKASRNLHRGVDFALWGLSLFTISPGRSGRYTSHEFGPRLAVANAK